MYLGYQKEKIKFYTETPLDKELYSLDRIEETEAEYVFNGDEYVLKTAEWETQQLQKAKDAKYTEALTKAYTYLGSGDAYYELREGITFEASDSNISKLTSCMLDLGRQEAFADAGDDITKIIENLINIFKGKISGKTIKWTTREDVLIDLNVLEIVKILKGIEAIQSVVWSIKYPDYLKQIKNAETIQEVNAIVIDYEQGAGNAVNIQ